MFSTNPCRQLRWGADGDTCFAMLRALCGMPNVDSAIQESCQSSLRGKHRTCSCHIMWYNVMCNCMRVYTYIIILYYIILWHIILYYIKLYYYIYIIMCVCACCLLTCGRTTKERERVSRSPEDHGLVACPEWHSSGSEELNGFFQKDMIPAHPGFEILLRECFGLEPW